MMIHKENRKRVLVSQRVFYVFMLVLSVLLSTSFLKPKTGDRSSEIFELIQPQINLYTQARKEIFSRSVDVVSEFISDFEKAMADSKNMENPLKFNKELKKIRKKLNEEKKTQLAGLTDWGNKHLLFLKDHEFSLDSEEAKNFSNLVVNQHHEFKQTLIDEIFNKCFNMLEVGERLSKFKSDQSNRMSFESYSNDVSFTNMNIDRYNEIVKEFNKQWHDLPESFQESLGSLVSKQDSMLQAFVTPLSDCGYFIIRTTK